MNEMMCARICRHKHAHTHTPPKSTQSTEKTVFGSQFSLQLKAPARPLYFALVAKFCCLLCVYLLCFIESNFIVAKYVLMLLCALHSTNNKPCKNGIKVVVGTATGLLLLILFVKIIRVVNHRSGMVFFFNCYFYRVK